MNTQTQLPLFDYDCTAGQAQQAQAESAAVIQDVIEKQAPTARLKSIGLNTAVKLANHQYGYQGESVLAALHCSNAISTLPATFTQALIPRAKDAFIRRGVSGLGNLIEITTPAKKERFFQDMQTYSLVKRSFAGNGKKTVDSQIPLFMYSLAAAIYHRITVGDGFSGVRVYRDYRTVINMNPDELVHMVFGELFQNGQPPKGFGELLRKSSFGQLTMQILRGELDTNLAPRAYSLKITKNKDGGLMQEITNGIFALFDGATCRITDSGFSDGFITVSLNNAFFPIKRVKQKGALIVDGSYSLFLAGLYPLLHCCAKWCKDNGRKAGVDADNQFLFFLAMQFSDKNAAQLGITNADFDGVFHSQFYRTVSTQHFIRLGEIPLAELLGCHNKNGAGRFDWGELAAKISMIARNFYVFLKEIKLLDVYKTRLQGLSKTRLYLPVDALATQGAVKIRTADFFEWCDLMEEAERKANAKTR